MLKHLWNPKVLQWNHRPQDGPLNFEDLPKIEGGLKTKKMSFSISIDILQEGEIKC